MASTSPAVSKRAPSAVFAATWPLEDARFETYADVAGLARTRLFGALGPMLRALTADATRSASHSCIADSLRATTEIAVGQAARDGFFMMARLGPERPRALGLCIRALSPADARPVALEGSTGAWKIASDTYVAFTSSGLVVYGGQALAERALGRRGGRPGLGWGGLGADDYVVWRAPGEPMKTGSHGSVLASDDRLRIDGEIDMHDDSAAAKVEEDASQAFREMHDVPPLPDSNTARIERVLRAVALRREGPRLAFTLQLRESPEEQANDLGEVAAAALAETKVLAQVLADSFPEVDGAGTCENCIVLRPVYRALVRLICIRIYGKTEIRSQRP